MKKVDPISTEIIRNAFVSIAQDMNAALIRSALYSCNFMKEKTVLWLY